MKHLEIIGIFNIIFILFIFLSLDFLWSKVSATYFSVPGTAWDHCSMGTKDNSAHR